MRWATSGLPCVLLLAPYLVVADDYISMTKHREELAVADQRFREQAEELQIERDIRAAYQLLAYELLRERADERAELRKRLSFLVADVLPKLPHKTDHRLFKEFDFVDRQLREYGHEGILDR